MRNDKEVLKPANYDSMIPPAMGESYTDEIFKESITRITDSMNQPDSAMGTAGSKVEGATVEYSTINPFNSDNTRLLLTHRSYFALYDGNGKYLYDLKYGSSYVNASSEPRWSRTNPTNFYFVVANKLMEYNTLTKGASVIQEFSEYLPNNSQGQNGVKAMGEGDISEDGENWALCGTLIDQSQEVFLYNLKNHTKSKVLKVKANAIDNIYATPDNNVIVGFYSVGEGRQNGVELYDNNMQFVRQVARAMGHQDVGRDNNGDEVLVWESAADPKSPFGNTAGSVKIRLADSSQKMLLDRDWSGIGAHIYCPKTPGWALISTFMPDENKPWRTYSSEILKVKMDGTEIQRLAHHRSRPLNDYTYMPKASGNADLSRIVYSSNFNLQRIKGYPKNYSDVYMIGLNKVVIETPVIPPPAVDPLGGFHKIDFSKAEGKEYLLKLKVVNGKLETEMWEK